MGTSMFLVFHRAEQIEKRLDLVVISISVCAIEKPWKPPRHAHLSKQDPMAHTTRPIVHPRFTGAVKNNLRMGRSWIFRMIICYIIKCVFAMSRGAHDP